MNKFKMNFWGWLVDTIKGEGKIEKYCFERWVYYACKFYKLKESK